MKRFKNFYNDLEKIDKSIWLNDHFYTIDLTLNKETKDLKRLSKIEKKYSKFIGFVKTKWISIDKVIYTIFLSEKAKKALDKVKEVW